MEPPASRALAAGSAPLHASFGPCGARGGRERGPGGRARVREAQNAGVRRGYALRRVTSPEARDPMVSVAGYFQSIPNMWRALEIALEGIGYLG